MRRDEVPEWNQADAAALADAEKLHKLLHVEKGVRPNEKGAYENKRVFLTVEKLARHLQSEEVWGVIVGYRKRCANFIGFDCDENWPRRLSALRAVLEEMGLARAAFATTGSHEGKGKVIITLARRMPYAQAHKLRDEIKERCAAHPDFGGVHKTKNKLDVFPTDGEGGVLRVGGLWKGIYNTFCTLHGEPVSIGELCEIIEPFRFKPEPVPIGRDRPGAYTAGLLAKPWPREHPQRLLKRLTAMAFEARSLHGEAAGMAEFHRWAEGVWSCSPELQRPSSKGRVIDWSGLVRKAWRQMLRSGAGWTPKTFRMIPKGSLKTYVEQSAASGVTMETIVMDSDRRSTIVSNAQLGTKSTMVSNITSKAILTKAQHQLYQALVSITQAHNLDRLRLSKDLRFLADATGRSHRNISKTLAQLERKGCIVRHLGPQPHWKACTYAIVGAGETRQTVLKLLGLDEEQLAERLRPPSKASKTDTPHPQLRKEAA